MTRGTGIKKTSLLTGVLGSLSLVLLLSACGGNSSSSSSSLGSTDALTTAALSGTAGGFGSATKAADGTSFTVSLPATYTPGKFASGAQPNQLHEGLNISATNGTKATLDLSTLIVTASTPAGACVDILDGDNAYNGAPQTPLAIGATTQFKWAISCPGKHGDALSFGLSINSLESVQLSGKL